MTFDTILAVLIGIGLSAAVGLRIFVPFLVMSIAAKSGYLPLAPGFEWIGTTPAIVAFAVATALEVAAYYVPWLDHVLDALATPVVLIAGMIAMASVVTDLPPLVKWSLAVIAGGGAAGLLHGATAAARAASTLATGGAANFVLASAELAGAVVTSVLAILVPLLALLAATALAIWLFGRRRSAPPS